jgi:hypothetical protein
VRDRVAITRAGADTVAPLGHDGPLTHGRRVVVYEMRVDHLFLRPDGRVFEVLSDQSGGLARSAPHRRATPAPKAPKSGDGSARQAGGPRPAERT